MITTIALVVALMFVGILLLAIEFFVIPGFGLPGILGIAGVVAAMYVAVTGLPAAYVAMVLVGSVIVAGGVFWGLPRTRTGKAMVLDTAITGAAIDEKLKDLLDREGTALTVLRPSGSVDIDDQPVDAVTDGQYVEAGTKVKVVRVEGGRVVVEAISDGATA